jgi:hypothetical protein
MLLASLFQSLFSCVIVILLGLSGYLWVINIKQDFTIRHQSLEIKELENRIKSIDENNCLILDQNNLLQANIQILNSYYRRKPKPPVLEGGELRIENLFKGDSK